MTSFSTDPDFEEVFPSRDVLSAFTETVVVGITSFFAPGR